jgi:hypothetical protein
VSPKGKFDDVPTEPMFDMEPVTKSTTQQGDIAKAKPLRTIARGRCSHCLAASVGLVRVGDHLVWRNHTKKTYSDANIPCRASSVRLCVAPARVVRFVTTPACPCGAEVVA